MCSTWRILLLLGIISALVFSEVCAKKKEKGDNEDTKSSRKGKGIWLGGAGTGMDHGHGHGWMKLHNAKHHGHSTKLSEAYVKFHGLGEKGSKDGGGILGRIGNVLNRLGIGRDRDADEDQSGWGSSGNGNSNNDNNGGWRNGGGGGDGGNRGGAGWGAGGGSAQDMITISVQGGVHGGGWGGGGPPSMMQMQSGWSNPHMQMVVAQPTGWASQTGPVASPSASSHSGGGDKGGSNGGNNRQVGWASGDFQTYKPPRGGNNKKGHFQLNFPTGRPAYIQKLKPIIDLPKLALHGWRR